MEKFKDCFSGFIVEKNESKGVEMTDKVVHKNRSRSKVINEIGSFILEHGSGEIQYLNDVDRMYIYARHKETPEITHRLIIRCDGEPIKKTCGKCTKFVPHEGWFCCSIELAEYYSDNGADILHFMDEKGDEDASDCGEFEFNDDEDEDDE